MAAGSRNYIPGQIVGSEPTLPGNPPKYQDEMMTEQIIKSSGNVFSDLGFSPEQSGKLAIKSYLMMQIESFIKKKGLTQDQASELMGVSRPRISDVMLGKIDKFTIDALVDLLTRAGFHIAVTVEHSPCLKN